MKKLMLFIFVLCICNAYAQPSPVSNINMLKNSKWPSQSSGKTIIPVSWENPSANNRQEREWVKEAIESSWEQHANIDFIGWGQSTSSSRGIRIIIDNYGHPHTKGLGTRLDGKQNGMLLNFNFFGDFKCPISRKDCIQFIAVHEFGHAIGLAHEHNRKDCLCNEAPQGTDGDFYVTPCDLSSVMNYCNPNWSNYGKLSALDIEGIQKIYGKPGVLKTIISLDEIRLVPATASNVSFLQGVKNKINSSSKFDISIYTEETNLPVLQRAVDRLPSSVTIRFFHPDDEDKVEKIKDYLISSGQCSRNEITIENMLPRMSKTYPKYIEIWSK